MENAMATQYDLFGNERPAFTTAKERYGVWPTTVWDIDYSDAHTKELKRSIGDAGQAREGSFTKNTEDKSVYRGKVSASVFSPAVTQYILNAFAPEPPARIFDPFGGGGTRAIMSAHSGYEYVGVELRPTETEACRRRIEAAGVADRALVVTGDARNQHTPEDWADFVITCPPYYDLEQYDGGDSDLSMADSYEEFLMGLAQVIDQTTKTTRPGGVACWVVGLHRDAAGGLLPLHHDIARLHTARGWTFKEEVVFRLLNTGAMQRIGQFDKGNRWLVRTHEYLLTFEL